MLARVLDVSLTRSCNFDCSWCNQRQSLDKPMVNMSDSKRVVVANQRRSGAEWIAGLSGFPARRAYVKVIFSGGEPSQHPDFFDIVTQVKGFRSKTIVTNLSFDVQRLIQACARTGSKVIVQPSFHFTGAEFDPYLEKLTLLRRAGLLSNFIPVSIVDLPDRPEPKAFWRRFHAHGFAASLYRFEGYYKGRFYYASQEGFGGIGPARQVRCASCYQCVRPNGDLVYCTTDTYSTERAPLANLCDQRYGPVPESLLCDRYGRCHVSASSWATMVEPTTGALVWAGKNFRERTPLNRVRFLVERQNYRWLATVKGVVNRVQTRLSGDRSDAQTNLG